MAIALGSKAYLGWGAETTWGTKVALSKYIPIRNESIRTTQGVIGSTSLRATRGEQIAGYFAGTRSVGGDFETELFVQGMLQLFYHAFGKKTDTVVVATKAWKHTFELDESLPTGLTIGVGRDFKEFQYSGCKINQLRLTFRSNEIVSATWSVVGKDETTGSVGTPTFPSNNTVFVTWKGTFKIGTTEMAISSLEVTLNNNLMTDRYGFKQTLVDLYPQNRTVTGTFTLLDPDETEYAKFLNFTPASLSLSITARQLDAGPPITYEEFNLSLPNVIYTGETPTVGGPGAITQNVPFTAYASDSTQEMTIYIVNNEATT